MSGGGVNINGQGSSGTGGAEGKQGGGGSNGGNGTTSSGGGYGAGGGGCGMDKDQGAARGAAGANGVVKIMWGTNKSFPSNVVSVRQSEVVVL